MAAKEDQRKIACKMYDATMVSYACRGHFVNKEHVGTCFVYKKRLLLATDSGLEMAGKIARTSLFSQWSQYILSFYEVLEALCGGFIKVHEKIYDPAARQK